MFNIYFFRGVKGLPTGFSFQFTLSQAKTALFEEAIRMVAVQGSVGVAGDE